jgi:uncharacterized protein YjiS (DUF1127 family)
VLIQMQFKVPVGVPVRLASLDRWRGELLAGVKISDGVRIVVTNWDKDGDPLLWLRKNKHEAEHAGVIARYAKRNQSFCDYDTVRHAGTIANIFRVARCLRMKPKWIEYRRTVRGWHVTVEWNRKFTPIETVALQAVLGSDPIREMFNLTRVLAGVAKIDKRWNVLFEKKVAE